MSLSELLKTFQPEKEIVEVAPLKYVEKDSDGVSLKGVLQRGRLKLGRAKKPRPQGITFRPSTITYGYCKRLKIGQIAGVVEIYDTTPPPRLQLVFDMGNAIHDIFQTYFWNIGILKGTYRCIKCDKLYHDLTSPTACPSGIRSHGKGALSYKEVQLKSQSLPISGRADGILVIEEEEHLADIKSIANKTISTSQRQVCFEDLEQPREAHIVQLNLYMWMAGIPKGHLFYVAKNDHKIKSFAIPYDKQVIMPYIDDIQDIVDKAEKLKMGKRVELPSCCGDESCHCHLILSKTA